MVNATLGSSLNSPLESPDILQRYLPQNNVCSVSASVVKSQQVRLHTFQKNHNSSYSKEALATTSFIETNSSALNSIATLDSTSSMKSSQNSISGDKRQFENTKLYTVLEHPSTTKSNSMTQTPILTTRNFKNNRANSKDRTTTFLEFSLSSVGRSFIDESGGNTSTKMQTNDSLKTPETPEPTVSPSSSSAASKSCFSETFSNDFIKPSTPSVIVSPLEEQVPKDASSTTTNNGGSWDLLELDLDFHHVNFDPSFGGDVEENLFFRDDFLGILPTKPTKPGSHDL